MSDQRLIDLEALVGHLLIAGGRAVSSAPPGALVATPPRRAGRGREGDTFFTLVTSSGKKAPHANMYTELARMAADYYFRGGGGVTSGLKEAFTGVHFYLREFDASPEIAMTCMVLRGGELYAGRAGACSFCFRQNGAISTYPDPLSDVLSGGMKALGVDDSPDVRLARYEVNAGDFVIIADANLARVEPPQISDLLNAGRTPEVMDATKALGLPNLQTMILEFVTAETPNPAPSKPARSTTISIALPSGKKNKTSELPAVQADSADPNATITHAEEGLPTESPPQVATPTERALPARMMLRLGGGLSWFGKGLGRALDRVLPEPNSEATPRIPTMLAAALAILVPILVVFVMVALRLSQFDMTQFERQVSDVQQVAEQARGIPLSDQKQAQAVWMAVLQRLDQVEASAGRFGDPALAAIRQEAQGILDTFDKVTRRAPTVIRAFGDEAVLASVVIRGGADLYSLDRTRSAIYRDTLNPAADALLARNAQPVVQVGQAVGAFAVRNLISITWMQEGGVQRANVLAALDTQGILVTYSPTFAPATAQRLPGVDLWGTPQAMFAWRGNLYILDPPNNQVWRYRPVGNNYPNPPEAYFEDDIPDLSLAVDVAIDSIGNVYILFADGTIKKYNGGAEVAFKYTDMPENAPRSGIAMYLDADSALPAIYIIDKVDQAVYQVTLSGTFKHRIKATDQAFADLSGVYVDRDHLYISSGGVLYFLSLADLTAEP
jgi:hypothetical protein